MATPSTRARAGYSIAQRLAIGATLWCGIALLVTGLVLVSLFQAQIERQFDTQIRNYFVYLVGQVARSDDAAGWARIASPPSSPQFRQPFSGWAWQVQVQDEVVAQSRSLGPIAGAPERITPPLEVTGDFDAPGGLASRGLARVITAMDGETQVTIAVAGPRSEITEALSAFRSAVIVSLSVLGAVLLGTILFLMRTSLRPLETLRAKVLAIRKGEPYSDPVWPRELAPVVDELDELTHHNDQLVRRARGAAADLAHAVKTPLSVLGQIAPRLPGEEAGAVRAQVDRISAYLNRHLGRSRAAGSLRGNTPVAPVVTDMLRTLSVEHRDRQLEVVTEVSPTVRFAGDETDLFEMLGNLIDNAGKWAQARIGVQAGLSGGRLAIEISDDGPGIPPDMREEILGRGRRLDESIPGQGLGLGIARDIAELYGGSLYIGASPLGGALIRLDLPGFDDRA